MVQSGKGKGARGARGKCMPRERVAQAKGIGRYSTGRESGW